MVNSAICTVNGSPLNTTGTTGANVSSGSTLTVALVNSAGVSSWSVLCTGVDELTNQAAINTSLSQNNTIWTATFTMPTTTQGAAMQFSSVVNGGPANAANGGNSFIFGVFVLYDGYRLFFGGESNESNATVGNAADLNKAVRTAATGGGGGGGFVAGGDLSGTSSSQTVIGIQGHSVASTSPSEGQFLIEGSGSTWKPTSLSGDVSASVSSPGDLTVVALQGNAVKSGTNGSAQDGYVLTWHNAASQFQVLPQTGGSGFTAGGDLTGSSTNQTVSKIQGTTISGTPASGKVIVASSSSAAAWSNVTEIDGVTVTGVPSAGQVITAIGPTTSSWQTPSGGGGFTAGGDLTGTSTSQKVVAIQGNPVNAATPTASQMLLENSSATGSVWTTLSQDGYLGTGSSSPATWRGLNFQSGIIPYNELPATSGSNYLFPDTADINYVYGKFAGSGATPTVKLNFSFEAMTAPTGSGTAVITNTITKTANTYCVNFFACLDALLAKGFTVIIGAHQYNSSTQVSFTYNNITIGNAGFSSAQFAQLWQQIAALYNTNSKVWFSLMNEPNSISTSVWTSAVQAAVTAIRTTATNTSVILLPTFNYSSAVGFFTNNYTSSDTTPAAACLGITDSSNNLMVEIHSYGDGPNYAGESTALDNTSVFVTSMAPILSWAATNSQRIYLGEFAADTANGIASTALANLYAEMNANTSTLVAATWWSYTSVGFGPSLFDLQPTTPYTVDAPDMALFTPLLTYSTGGGTLGALEVTGLLTHQLPALTDGYLNWTGSAWALSSVSGGFTAGGDLSGTSTSQVVDSAQSGLLTFTATTGNILAASTATAPGISQTTVATNSATGKNLSLSAQSASGTTSVGGNVVLTPGTGTSTNGLIQLAPSNAVYNFEPAQGSIVNQSGVSGTYTGYIQTTDGSTAKNVLVIPIPTGKTMVANIMLVGRLSTGVTTYAQLIFGGAENASGTAALFTGSGHVFQNTATLYDTAYAAAGASGAGAVLAVSGANFEVTIAGVSATTINWTCVAEVVFC